MSSWLGDPEPDRHMIQKRERWARSCFCSKVLTHSKHQLINTRYNFITHKQWLIRASISIGPHSFQQPATIARWIQLPELNGHIGSWTASRRIKHMCGKPTCHLTYSRLLRSFSTSSV